MAVKKDERMVKSKKNKDKLVKKITYKCEGSYVDANGNNKRYHKRGFATKSEAQQWEEIFLAKARNEIDTGITYGILYEIYKETKKGKIKDRSYNDMEYLFSLHILPHWSELQINKITLKKIEDWQTKLLNTTHKVRNQEKHFSNKYLESIQMQFKAVLRYGYQMGYTNDQRIIFFDYAKRNDEQKKEMQFWEPDEYNRFISVCDELPYKTLYSTLYWCGIRLGEALALNWNDVDFKKKTISISKSYSKHTHQITSPKTKNSYRSVIVPDKCLSLLEALKNEQKCIIGYNDKNFVFYFNKPLDENAIRERKNNWCKVAGIKQIKIHELRHSHVSLLIHLGFSPFDIAKRLGHTVEMVNNVYGHWFNEAQQSMVDKLNNL